jgi:hypothetical protein
MEQYVFRSKEIDMGKLVDKYVSTVEIDKCFPANKIAVDDMQLPYAAKSLQEVVEKEQTKVMYGGNY